MPCARDATDLRPAATTLKGRAIASLREYIYPERSAVDAIEDVLAVLVEPDRDMLDAGRAELDLALGKPADRQHGAAYRRDLCAVIWRAMLDRVQG